VSPSRIFRLAMLFYSKITTAKGVYFTKKIENFAFYILHFAFFVLPLHRIIAIKYLINKKHIQDEKGNSSRELSFGGIQGYVE
jgi:hypothetical protein